MEAKMLIVKVDTTGLYSQTGVWDYSHTNADGSPAWVWDAFHTPVKGWDGPVNMTEEEYAEFVPRDNRQEE